MGLQQSPRESAGRALSYIISNRCSSNRDGKRPRVATRLPSLSGTALLWAATIETWLRSYSFQFNSLPHGTCLRVEAFDSFAVVTMPNLVCVAAKACLTSACTTLRLGRQCRPQHSHW